MAKDPAFLFYPGDWMGGTMTMSRHLKGCYMDLLIAQFNSGPLSLDQIKTLLGQDQASWTVLREKFKREVNSAGGEVFFNERLVTEIEKRKRFIEKQSLNGSKGGRPPNKPKNNLWVNPNKSLLENENEIKNENLIRGRGAGEGELWTEIVKSFYNDFYWIEKFCRDKHIDQKSLERKQREFISDIELREEFKGLKELKNHFTNWFNKNKNGISATKHSSKTAGAHQLLEELRANYGTKQR